MYFQLLKRKKANAQKLLVFTSLVIILFLPLSLNRGEIVYALPNPSSTGSTTNIPLSIPTTNSLDPRPVTEEEQVSVNKLADSMMSNLQISPESENQVSALATCDKLPVSAVTASGNDGNVPSNVFDNNLNTRWSNLGQGSWVELDLGSKKSICSVDIAWYRGDVRQNNFIISVSDDGTTFTNQFSGTSSGTTTSPEKYTIPAGTEGRYVRITVNGNTENEWASITEIAVFGGATGGGGSNVIGTLFHKWQTAPGSSTWSAYSSLSGAMAPNTDLAAAMNSDGRLQVFVVGTNNQLYYKTQTSAGSSLWTGWTSLGGGIKSDTSPAVARNSDGRLQVFVVGTNNQLYYKTQTSAGSSTWSSSWTSLGGGLRASTDPVVVANSDGRLQAFVVGTHNALYYKTQTTAGSSTWTGWTYLGGGIKSDTSPAVARNSDGRLQVFIVGTNNQLYYKTQMSAGSSTWSSSWTSLGGGLRASTDPVVVANSDGRLQAFVVGTHNALYYKTQTSAGSSTWSSSWTPLGGGIKADTSPAVARNNDGGLQVFVVGTNNQLYYKTQTSAGSGTWSSSWTSLGGTLRENTDPAVVPNSDGRLEAFVMGPTSTGPPNPPPGGSTTRDGVTVPFKIKGQWDYEYETDERDGGARYNMNAAGTSLVMVGYFRSSGGSDDVAMKLLGGRHTDSAPYDGCVYDPAIAVDSGQPRLRAECPHPDYTGNLDLDFEQQGVSIHNRWVGFMAVALQEQAGVRIQVYQDQGNNDNQPANQWVKVLEFFDDGTKVSGIEGADRFPLRELPATAQNTFRIDETPGLQEKWLAIAEIDLSVLSSVQFIQPPTADSKSVTTGTNAAVDITLSGTDPNNDTIAFSIVDQPMHGQLSTISAQNIVTYTPTTGYIGPDSFTYVARDSKGATSINKATVSITVSSTDGGTNDKFGIKKIYPTKPGGEEWYEYG